MQKIQRTYDLHITVVPESLDSSLISLPWRIHDIQNTQGMPHYIVSQQYIGDNPSLEIQRKVEELERAGVLILRKKIELHFSDSPAAHEMRDARGIVEVHYKLKRRGTFEVNQSQVSELTQKMVAFSFNRGNGRCILSVRFKNQEAYITGDAHRDFLPSYIESKEKEVVIMDSNNALDDFWPLRDRDNSFSFNDVPAWLTLV